jgi:hypothetical protein
MSQASTPLRTRWTIPLKEQDLQIFYVLVVLVLAKEYEILRSPGSGASLLKTGQVYNYCVMRGIFLSAK